MYEYVGPGTRAAEGTDLDQVLSCLFPGGSSTCSTLPTLPGSASVVVASSLCRECFLCFFAQNKGCGIISMWA